MESLARERLLRRGRMLDVFTVAWNSLEGALGVFLGLVAGRIALVGFGIDSFIETTSGLVLLWRLQARRDLRSEPRRRLCGWSGSPFSP